MKKLNVDKTVLTYKQQQIDISAEVEAFLTFQRSEKTKSLYNFFLGRFFKYLDFVGLDIRTLKAQNVDTWLLAQLARYSSRSVLAQLGCIGSFYKNLIVRHPDVFTVNIFHGRRLPPIVDKFKKDLVTDQDLSVIKLAFKNLGRLDMIVVINLLDKYGFSSGIFEKMQIDETTNKWTSVSKGKSKSGAFTKKEVQQILAQNILGRKVSVFQTAYKRQTTRLYKLGLITSPSSLHDIRRKVILGELEKSGAVAFLKVSKKYHKNPSTTFSYVDTLAGQIIAQKTPLEPLTTLWRPFSAPFSIMLRG